MTKNNLSEIAKLLSGFEKLITISHFNPDPDALSSSSALALGLQQCGKETVVVNANGSHSRFGFIPGVEAIQKEFPSGSWDAVVVCDCADISRVGEDLLPFVQASGLVINIDHHISNTFYGNYNLVWPEASSTAEIINELLAEMKIEVTPVIANALLAGMMHDTGSFRFSSVSPRTFEIAASLLRKGAELHQLADNIFGERSLASVKLQAEALSNLTLHCQSKVVEVLVTEEMFKQHQAAFEDCEYLVEAARDIEGVVASAFIRVDYGEKWKVSLRSSDSRCNVSDVALEFGGGGHKQAAAFRCRMPLSELRDKLYKLLERELKKI